MTITIPDSALAQANIKPDELLIELVVTCTVVKIKRML